MFAWITFIMPEWYVKIFTILFAVMLFAYAYGFYSVSFRNRRGFRVKIDKNSISLPFKINKKVVRLDFRDIEKVEIFENFEGKSIAIFSESNNGFIELERNWMRKNDFNDLFSFLKNKVNK